MRLILTLLLLCGLPALSSATALSDAVQNRDLDLVRKLLAGGADPNEAAGYEDTPLQAAARQDAPQIALALLEAGADPDLRREYGTSPLGAAAMHGSVETLLVLLDRVADPGGSTDDQGRTALHYAALGGEPSAVSVLLRRELDANARDASGETPLILAARCIMSDPAPYTYESIVSQLLRAGAAVNAQSEAGTTALIDAAAFSSPQVVALLLEADANVDLADAEGTTALMRAAERPDDTPLRLLLGRGAKLGVRDEDGCTAALRAAKRGETGTLALLLEAGDGMTYPGDATQDLGVAAVLGDAQKAAACIAAGADLTAQDLQDYTPLMRAVTHGHLTVTQLLLEAGADPACRAGDGWRTPLQAAAGQGDPEVVKAILDRHPADEEWQASLNGALLVAAEYGNLEAARVLLDRGASVSAGEEYTTALTEATRAGALPLVQLLLDRGAQASAHAEYSRQPLAFAAELGFADIAQLLLERGADLNDPEVEWGYLQGGPSARLMPVLGVRLAEMHLAKARTMIEAAQDAEGLVGARGELEAAAIALPGDPRTHYNLGLLQAQLGDPQAARRSLESALALAPDGALAGDVRQRLSALPAP